MGLFEHNNDLFNLVTGEIGEAISSYLKAIQKSEVPGLEETMFNESRQNGEPNFADRLKARLGRYYKILVPYAKVRLGLSMEGKNTSFVIKSSIKESKKFFRARVYNLPELMDRIRSKPHSVLQKEEIRELVETLPLLLLNIVMTRKRWYIGKIENNPFDIFIAQERFVEVKNKNLNIYRGLHIQTKRLYTHLPKQMTLDEWLIFIQSTIAKKISKVDFGCNGHIHFYNHILLSKPVSLDKLKILFKKLYVPYNKYVDSISVSVELVNREAEKTIVTWYIYPLVSDIIGILDLDLERARKIYLANSYSK